MAASRSAHWSIPGRRSHTGCPIAGSSGQSPHGFKWIIFAAIGRASIPRTWKQSRAWSTVAVAEMGTVTRRIAQRGIHTLD